MNVELAAARPLRLLLGLVISVCATGRAAAQTPYHLVHEWPESAGDILAPALVQSPDGWLYGCAARGLNFYGEIFAVAPNAAPGSAPWTVHAFTGRDGAYPWGGLLLGSDGNLYGTTFALYDPVDPQAASGPGSVFRLPVAGGTVGDLMTLHVFGPVDPQTGANLDGSTPVGALTEGRDGRLYGVTTLGGAHAAGTIFSLGRDGSGEFTQFTTLHEFQCDTGCVPTAGLVEGSDGRLYGTTSVGGLNDVGTVFELSLDDGGPTTYTVLHDFDDTVWCSPSGDGFPWSTLVEGADDRLYGASVGCGVDPGNPSLGQSGAVFQLERDESGHFSRFTILRSGDQPLAVVVSTDGDLYGISLQGGAFGGGAVFELGTDPDSGLRTRYRLQHSLPHMASTLVAGIDGRLFGIGGFNGYPYDTGSVALPFTLFSLVPTPTGTTLTLGDHSVLTSGFSVLLVARLTDADGAPRLGETVTLGLLHLDTNGYVVSQVTCDGATDVEGFASCTLDPGGAGPVGVAAYFAGDVASGLTESYAPLAETFVRAPQATASPSSGGCGGPSDPPSLLAVAAVALLARRGQRGGGLR